MKKQFWLLFFVLNLILSHKTQAVTLYDCSPVEGTNTCTATLGDDGVLTVSGTGQMADYVYNSAPWMKDKTSITSVVVEEGITRIGNCAFEWASNITSIKLPDTLTSVGASALYGLTNVGSLVIPSSVTTIEGGAFANMFQLENLTIPDSLISVGKSAFSRYDYNAEVYVASYTVKNLDIDADMLSIYLNAKGGFDPNGATIKCKSGDCMGVLKAWDDEHGTNYAGITNIEMKNADGSLSVMRGGNIIGYKNKRIYTVNEINQIAGKKNKVKIRYK